MFCAGTSSTSRTLRLHLSLAGARCQPTNTFHLHPQFVPARFLPRISRAPGLARDEARIHQHHGRLGSERVIDDNPPLFRKELLREDPSHGSKRFAEEGVHPPVMRQILVSRLCAGCCVPRHSNLQFVFGGTIVAYNVAAYLTERDTQYWASRLRATKLWQVAAATSEDMRRARMFQLAKVRLILFHDTGSYGLIRAHA